MTCHLYRFLVLPWFSPPSLSSLLSWPLPSTVLVTFQVHELATSVSDRACNHQ
jgi:hypothetical protein